MASLPLVRQMNIGNLTLSRTEHELALCLMTVDGSVPKEALAKMKANSTLQDVRTAAL
jgi:hypothetical protein